MRQLVSVTQQPILLPRACARIAGIRGLGSVGGGVFLCVEGPGPAKSRNDVALFGGLFLRFEGWVPCVAACLRGCADLSPAGRSR